MTVQQRADRQAVDPEEREVDLTEPADEVVVGAAVSPGLDPGPRIPIHQVRRWTGLGRGLLNEGSFANNPVAVRVPVPVVLRVLAGVVRPEASCLCRRTGAHVGIGAG